MQRAAKHPPARRIVSGLISLAIVVGIFVFAIPKVADYSEVWKEFESSLDSSSHSRRSRTTRS